MTHHTDNKRIAMGIGIALALGLAGCGSDSTTDAKTAQAAMSELVSSVDTTMLAYASKQGGHGSLTVDCASGGKADVSGHVNIVKDPLAVDVNVAIDYQSCKTVKGNTLSGSIDFVEALDKNGSEPRVAVTYNGDVELSGNINAQCAVNVSVIVDTSAKSVSVTGHACGREASSLSFAIQPSWK